MPLIPPGLASRSRPNRLPTHVRYYIDDTLTWLAVDVNLHGPGPRYRCNVLTHNSSSVPRLYCNYNDNLSYLSYASTYRLDGSVLKWCLYLLCTICSLDLYNLSLYRAL